MPAVIIATRRSYWNNRIAAMIGWKSTSLIKRMLE